MVRVLKKLEQVDICEKYEEDRFSIEELAILYDISKYQVKSVLDRFEVPERTEML